MFDITKFGRYLAALRKKADMTQMELADRLCVTRQAISKYEQGESFPNVSILVLIAEVFHITLDELIGSGDPTNGEATILKSVAIGEPSPVAENIRDVVNLAPLLKPSILDKLSASLSAKGIDISNILKLAEFLNSESTVELLKNADFDQASDDLIEQLLPWMDITAQFTIFQKILDGEMDIRLLKPLVARGAIYASLIEYSVVEGALPASALELLRSGLVERSNKNKLSAWW
ncbi:MAG: XRE family transcriptional regulator [Clostridia bacterium]|nr:XRE family transcriptional regulator [Clostridia bacterium]